MVKSDNPFDIPSNEVNANGEKAGTSENKDCCALHEC